MNHLVWADGDRDGLLDAFSPTAWPAAGLLSSMFRGLPGGKLERVDRAPLTTDPGNCNSATWADIDNDGDLDLFVANDGYPSKLFRNDGGGVFVDATSGSLGVARSTKGVAWGDYDNDGDVDLYLSNNGPNKLFRNDGGGVFTDATNGPLGDAGNGMGVAWGDYDNDGDLDLYLASNGSANKLFRTDNATGNHWLQVDLIGTVSNRSGIGMDQ